MRSWVCTYVCVRPVGPYGNVCSSYRNHRISLISICDVDHELLMSNERTVTIIASD